MIRFSFLFVLSIQISGLRILDLPSMNKYFRESCGLIEWVCVDGKIMLSLSFMKFAKKVSKILLSGVLSSDLYQMYAYSVKYNASDCILVYPSIYKTDDNDPHYFEDNNRLRIWELNMNLKDGNWESKLAKEIKPLMAKLFPQQ